MATKQEKPSHIIAALIIFIGVSTASAAYAIGESSGMRQAWIILSLYLVAVAIILITSRWRISHATAEKETDVPNYLDTDGWLTHQLRVLAAYYESGQITSTQARVMTLAAHRLAGEWRHALSAPSPGVPLIIPPDNWASRCRTIYEWSELGVINSEEMAGLANRFTPTRSQYTLPQIAHVVRELEHTRPYSTPPITMKVSDLMPLSFSTVGGTDQMSTQTEHAAKMIREAVSEHLSNRLAYRADLLTGFGNDTPKYAVTLFDAPAGCSGGTGTSQTAALLRAMANLVDIHDREAHSEENRKRAEKKARLERRLAAAEKDRKRADDEIDAIRVELRSL